ncbi:MAG: type VI secretion system protein TssA, partial [Gammaproteobacteria bacterium]|nr:type VI secretion system protein TssA [Gammaproteobacteria bacterium]
FQGLLERYWEGVHPQLDPDDDNDPTMRINIISSLTDSSSILLPLNTAPLVSSRAMGRFSLRDIDIATGNLPAPKDGNSQPPELSTIEAAFMDAPLEDLQETASSISSSMEHLQAIDAALIAQVGAGTSPDLSPLTDLLKHSQREVNQRLEQRTFIETPSAELPDGEELPGGTATAGTAPVRSAVALSGEVNSREDAIHAMDKICDYYKRHEPSSPVPMLIQRAKRLSTMDFMTILRDLTPDGVSQMETIRGEETDGDGDY